MAQVVLVDEYKKGKSRSFESIKNEAFSIQNRLLSIREQLKLAEDKYFKFQQATKKNPRQLKYRKAKRRKKFSNTEEERLYRLCYSHYDHKIRLKKKKNKLIHAVTFFTISIAPGEDPTKLNGKFIKFAKDYHERWRIENGFRDTKYQFLHKSRSQKSTRRQFYWIA
ncbi:MAG: hypothetical protein K9W44_09840 [Candidatus Lokiarchaeota archaeon]|nr:hypothetical protein [Candidatus Harpocratesius repetitus]